MPQLTALRYADLTLTHTKLNFEFLGKTISDLNCQSEASEYDSVIVLGAGPSLQRRDPAVDILRSGYRGVLVAADGALPYCLRNGLVPQYVVTLDSHPSRIVRWFGDPDLTKVKISEDDYYSRQDLDQYLGEKELERNAEVIALVNQYSSQMRAIVATCISPRVTRRCLDAGFEIFWWNPLYDDYNDPGSLVRQVYSLNQAPCMATGGNTGSAAWVFANVILNAKEIALLGMDFSYAPGTPLANTQYYQELVDLFGDQAAEAYIEVWNPHLQEAWLTDPTYYWYRETFLQMLQDSECKTYNCTEGGILFGDGVEFVSLQQFLVRHENITPGG